MLTNQFKNVYQFKIVLKGIQPPVWRRIQVPENCSFKDLHIAIQNVMDWEVYAGSSYDFHVINPSTGLAQTISCFSFGLSQFAGINEPAINIADYFSQPKVKFDYTSENKARWNFTVEFEKIVPADKFEMYPVCIKGKRAAPPDDCGGVEKYQAMLDAHNKSKSGKAGKKSKPSHDFFDDDFDPEYFDPDNLLFTSSSGNNPLPDDFPDMLLKLLKKS